MELNIQKRHIGVLEVPDTETVKEKQDHSDIYDVKYFYAGKTVALTGGTGFLGQGIIEKLLRTCPKIKKIVIFIREKKNVSPSQRIRDLAKLPAFDVLRKIYPNFDKKLTHVSCDLAAENLGLDKDSIRMIQREVDVFIHCAATLRFNEHLRAAFEINVQCVRRLISICRNIRGLSAFVHISTAYSNTNQAPDTIQEKIYDQKIDYIDLEATLKWMDDETITKITPEILEKRPNTYTLTKAMAEDVVLRESGNMPVCIVRPSMIIPALSEPSPGWCTNAYGPTAFVAAFSKGVLRSMHADLNVIADLVPVDLVVNGVIISAMKTGLDHYKEGKSAGYESGRGSISDYQSSKVSSSEDESFEPTKHKACQSCQKAIKPKHVPVYTFNTGTHNPLPIKKLHEFIVYWVQQCPILPIRAPGITITSSIWMHNAITFCQQTIPAHIIDVGLKLQRKKFRVSIANKKIIAGGEVMDFFFCNSFNWNIDKSIELRDILSEKDKKTFYTLSDCYEWHDYMRLYVEGVGEHILKEDIGKIDYAKSRQRVQRMRTTERCIGTAAALGLVGLTAFSGMTNALWEVSSSLLGGLSYVM